MSVEDSPQAAEAYLEPVGGNERVLLNGQAPCRIGRDANNTVVIADDLVSRNHALIECVDDSEYYVTDLGSRNGTLVDGAPIRCPTKLADGAQLGIGPYTFVFHNTTRTPRQRVNVYNSTVAHVSLEVITVLVIDVRGFTEWTRLLGPEKVTKVMALLFGDADAVLGKHRAWAHKYIGDAVMAIWRHRDGTGDVNPVRSALFSTVELFQSVAHLNLRAQLPSPLRMGAGLNTGLATVGNLGSDRNADYTALGDSVNKAFRLESATRTADCDILIGDASYHWLGPELRRDIFSARSVTLKGFHDKENAWAASVTDLATLLGYSERCPPTAGPGA